MRTTITTTLLVLVAAISAATAGDRAQKGPDFGADPPSTRDVLAGAVHDAAVSYHGIGVDIEVVLVPDEHGDLNFMGDDPLGLERSRTTRRGTPRTRPVTPAGACDTDDECTTKVKDMCEAAGHGGVKDGSVTITKHVDGSKTCSGDCLEHGAVAFAICKART